MSYDLKLTYISLIKLGIGHKADIPEEIEWKAVRQLASKQGLAAVVLDGVNALIERGLLTGGRAMDIDLKFDWMGESVVAYEQRYEAYRNAICSLAIFYSYHGHKMMILKGYGLSLNYPVPAHRPCGDIDIYQFGQYKEADLALGKELGINVDDSHHHHTTFRYDGFLVENHYDFINVHYGHGNKELEKILKSLAEDSSSIMEVGGEKVYLPSANLHALFQIRHCVLHFASSEINIRHLLDWALFVEKHSSEIDWKWLVGVLRDFHMLDFFNYLNAICVEDLGFDARLFPSVAEMEGASGVDVDIKKRILADILTPEFTEEEPVKKGIIARVAFKFRRWQANAWKQKLCYSDNRLIAFWQSVWDHLLKPSSI
ncbi:MAG: hypothetical protein E7108_02495 [Bacteroidales bacterium]|jgi:hypothetical protein|nr:hypothetical protein [Bacteroidales bacterium]